MAHFMTVCRWSQIMHNLDPSIARHLRQCNLTWNGGNSSSSSSNDIPSAHAVTIGCDGILFRGTRRTNLCAFSAVSRLPLEGISWKFIPHTSRMRYTWCKLGRGRPIIKGTLPGEQCAFSAVSAVSWLPLEWFFCKFIPRYLHAFATNIASVVATGQ